MEQSKIIDTTKTYQATSVAMNQNTSLRCCGMTKVRHGNLRLGTKQALCSSTFLYVSFVHPFANTRDI